MAYDEGVQCHREDGNLSENPYEKGGLNHQQWIAGWVDRDTDADEFDNPYIDDYDYYDDVADEDE